MGKFLNSFIGDVSKKAEGISEQQGSLASAASSFGQMYGRGTGMKNAWMGGGIQDTGFSNALDIVGQALQVAGPAGQVASAGLTTIGNTVDLFAYNPEVSPIKDRYDAYSPPTFNLQSEIKAANNFSKDFKRDANRKIVSNLASGAGVGAAIGGPIGAGVGALIGGGSALIGKVFGSKKAEDAQNKMQAEIKSSYNAFNAAQDRFYGLQNARERYSAKMSENRSLYGLPTQSPYMFN